MTLTMKDLLGLSVTLQGGPDPAGGLELTRETTIDDRTASSAGHSVKSVRQTGNAAQIAGRCERRDPATGLNQTEAAFLKEVLRPLQAAGLILRIDFEPEGLRAGLPGSRSVYWPDFRLQWADGIIDFMEVKGHWLEDARVKIKAVAALHPYTFRAVTRRPKKEGGGWLVETFGPWTPWLERIETAARITP